MPETTSTAAAAATTTAPKVLKEFPVWTGPLPKGLLPPQGQRKPKEKGRRLKFHAQRFSINALESLEDVDMVEGTHERQRRLLFSLPRTLKMTLEAFQAQDSTAAIKIYDALLSRSCMLDNKMRKSFFATGGGKRLLCTSKNIRRAKSVVTGNFQTDPKWIDSFPEETKSESCTCFQCSALAGDKDSQRQLGILFYKGFLADKDPERAILFWKLALPHKDAFLDLAQVHEGTGKAEEDEKAFDYYLKAAEMGNSKALFEVGLAHLISEELRDVNRALSYLNSAADMGMHEADLELGEFYSSGVFRAEEPVKATFHYIRGAERGNVQAQWIIAQAYESGYGVEKSIEKATHWYFKAAENEHAEAQRTLGYFYEVGSSGDGILEQDFQKAFYWYERASAQKDMIAMFNLSNMFWKGKGIPKSLDQAIYWCTEAAEQGDTAAQVRVAEILKERADPATKDEKKMIYWLDLAANDNNLKAQFLLGKCFLDGTGVEQDNEECLAWYTESASGGYAEAQFALANIYREGQIVGADDAVSFSWCQRAAEQGHPAALGMLARSYETGKGCSRDMNKAIECYEEAVAKNDPAAQFYLGFLYQTGSKYIAQNLKRAFELYQASAEQGDKRSQSNLGSMYKKGLYVPQDFKKAVYWFKKSAEQDHPRAQANLGLLYENGLGVEKDYEEAAKWYYRAACHNNEKAQLRFALLCQQGLGVRQNEVEAVYWFENAAKQGNAVALYNMGRAYEDGVLVEQDYTKAVQMYEQAVEKANSAAKLRLANLYEHGTGVPKNNETAMKYYEQAAKDGVVEAQVAYAVRLERNKDIPGNSEQAVAWFKSAADLGSISAQFYLGKLASRKGKKEEAIFWYEKCALQKHIPSHLILATMYEAAKDMRSANSHIIQAAELGNGPAQVKAFHLLKDSDKDRALDYLKKSADTGSPEGQYTLAVVLQEGKYIPTDDIASAHWLTLSANQAHSLAQLTLARAYCAGKGVAKSLDHAIDLLRESVCEIPNESIELLVSCLTERNAAGDRVRLYCWSRLGKEYGIENCLKICQELESAEPSFVLQYSELQIRAQFERRVAFCSSVTHSSSILKKWVLKGLSRENLSLMLTLTGNTMLVVDVERLDVDRKLTLPVAELTPEDFYKRASEYFHGKEHLHQDYVQARHWYELAANKGHVESMFTLGNMNWLGLGQKPNHEVAIYWYNQAADCDYLPALKALGSIYSQGKEVPRDPVAALCFWLQAQEMHNDPEAGIEVKKLDNEDEQYRRTYRELRDSANDERKFVFLSGCSSRSKSALYSKFRKSPLYHKKAVKLIFKMLGDACLIVRQGEDMIDFLRKPEVDFKDLEKKAAQGDKETQYQLGLMYLNGTDDMKPNFDKAGYWFACAGKQDHSDAWFRLGSMYDRGIGFKPDLDKAVEMYEAAAYMGHLEALRLLGSMAKTGRGLDQDFLEAYCWYQLAYQFGDLAVKKDLEFIENQQKSVKREYQDLKGTALSLRKIALLSGLHSSAKSSRIYHCFRVRLPQLQLLAPSSLTVKSESDILRNILELSGDTLLLVNPGMELTEFLRRGSDSDNQKLKVDEAAGDKKPSSPRGGNTNKRASRLQEWKANKKRTGEGGKEASVPIPDGQPHHRKQPTPTGCSIS